MNKGKGGVRNPYFSPSSPQSQVRIRYFWWDDVCADGQTTPLNFTEIQICNLTPSG
jgi:hypothetical protein